MSQEYFIIGLLTVVWVISLVLLGSVNSFLAVTLAIVGPAVIVHFLGKSGND